MPDTPRSRRIPTENEVTALLHHIERLRHATFRRPEFLIDELDVMLRRTDRMIGQVAGTPYEARLRSGRALLHCIYCGIAQAA